MVTIRCPLCNEMVFLNLADWENFTGQVALGKPTRVGLICQSCHNEFLLQIDLSQVIRVGAVQRE